MKPILLSLPDELADWRGTAAELADQCNEVLAGVPSLTDDAGSANERLVRHYVQVGVLTAPEREGREALFGLRQIVEFLATRYLLKDGWPLAKAAEIVRTTDVDRPRAAHPVRTAAHARRGSRREIPAAARPARAPRAASRQHRQTLDVVPRGRRDFASRPRTAAAASSVRPCSRR